MKHWDCVPFVLQQGASNAEKFDYVSITTYICHASATTAFFDTLVCPTNKATATLTSPHKIALSSNLDSQHKATTTTKTGQLDCTVRAPPNEFE